MGATVQGAVTRPDATDGALVKEIHGFNNNMKICKIVFFTTPVLSIRKNCPKNVGINSKNIINYISSHKMSG